MARMTFISFAGILGIGVIAVAGCGSSIGGQSTAVPPASARASADSVPGSAAAASPATGDTPGTGSVPAAILGTWSGIAYPAAGAQISVEVTIVQGGVGETVEHSTLTYTYLNLLCTGQGVLVSASAREIVTTGSNSSANAMCSGLEGAAPVQVTYRLNTSGTLQVSLDSMTTELAKQS